MLQRLHLWDTEISQRLRLSGKASWARRVGAFFAHSGDSWFWFVGLGMVWLLAPAWRYCVEVTAGAVFGTAVLVMALKFAIRRRRPEGEWGAIYRLTDPHSFPSGHAARVALLAVLAWGCFPPGGAIVMGMWALGVAAARVAMGVHYLSDVLAGALLGMGIGAAVLHWLL